MTIQPQPMIYPTTSGLHLTADAWGNKDARPALFLHGGGQTRHAWGGTARSLAERGWYAVTLDMRGHGDSPWATHGDYTLEAFVADLRDVLTHFPEQPVLIGASLGGMTALLMEGEAPEPTSAALVLVDVTPRVESQGVARIRAFMTGNPDGFATLEEVADAVATYIPHRPRPTDLRGLAKNVRRRDNGRYYWHWDPKLLASHNRGRDSERLLNAARTLHVPTLLVRGQLSDIVSEATQAEFLAAVPHAQYADIAGAGHMVAGDQNDAFGRAIFDFLENI